MNRKRLFFLGISPHHVKLSIERAKRLGFEVIFGDSAEKMNAYSQLVAQADQRVIVDYTSYESVLRVVQQLQQEAPLDAIFTFKEAGALVVAQVIEQLHLYGNHPDVIEHCNDKFSTRQLLKQAGFAGPSYALCSTLQELKHFFQQVQSPIVIKPHNLMGSVGVIKIEAERELEKAFTSCLSYSQEPVILAEEFIHGREISLEAMVYHGQIILFGVTEKLLYPDSFVEAGHITPDSGQELSIADYREILHRITQALGITFGPLHIEGFHTRQGFMPGEVHTRYGGDQIVLLTEMAKKCDMLSPVFAELGHFPYDVTFGSPQEFSGIRFLDVKPGIVVAVEGMEALRQVPGVVNYHVSCQPGDSVSQPGSSFERVGWIVARAATREALQSIFQQALRTLHIITQ